MSEIDAVAISAGSIEAPEKKNAPLLTPIHVYTTAGANGQISSVLETLPGVQKLGESEGLFVRGGETKETKFFMDGNLVNNYFGNSVPGIKAMDRFEYFTFQRKCILEWWLFCSLRTSFIWNFSVRKY